MGLTAFVKESNRIEGILRDPTPDEIEAHKRFINGETVGIAELQAFVAVIQPNAVLRDRAGLDVRVGAHIAPRGGIEIVHRLERLFNQMKAHGDGPARAWTVHCEYEWIHPFTDGNGRSGRALWLRMMRGQAPLGFLHHFYYQTLASQN